MRADHQWNFPVARYRFSWRVTRPIRLPAYAGSMLRGAFGHALRQVACMTKQKTCEGCPLLTTCAYPALFAPPPPSTHALQKFTQIPVPYIIEPPAWGEQVLMEGAQLSFHMVLAGNALKELPLIILAWRRALARGLGAGDGTAELESVHLCADDAVQEVFTPASGIVAPHQTAVTYALPPALPPPSRIPAGVTLEFDTPLRLQQNGRALAPHRLDARTLLMALIRRINLLAEFHTGTPLICDFTHLATEAANLVEKRELVWRDWVRYSSRQQQTMALGGVVGKWQLQGELAPFLPWLHLGQWLHVGKEAAFGLGSYRLSFAGEKDQA